MGGAVTNSWTPTAAHLLRMHPRRPRHGRHRNPLRIQMPTVRQRDIVVRERHAVLSVPPRLVHRDTQTLTRPVGRRRRRDGAGVERGIALVSDAAGHDARVLVTEEVAGCGRAGF
ncbi:hypothetical protein D1007_13092 [Hordeum vulgare]|nr:hypothetical protein D1007_13092 [Hordeum vulgare]